MQRKKTIDDLEKQQKEILVSVKCLKDRLDTKLQNEDNLLQENEKLVKERETLLKLRLSNSEKIAQLTDEV